MLSYKNSFLKASLFILGGTIFTSLSGCGFRPLLSDAQPVAQTLQSVKISVISDRVGQQVRNRLQDLMTPQGQPVDPKYRLDVTLAQTDRELSFRKDLVARRKEISLKARFNLINLQTGKPVFENFSEAYQSFSMGPSSDFAAYSSYVSENDARNRMVEIIANDIFLQVSTFLHHYEKGIQNEINAGKI